MNLRIPIILLFIALTGMAACKKSDNVAASEKDPPLLNVINAGADTINFFLNGTRQNNTSSIYSAGSTGYFDVLSGTQKYSFKKAAPQSIVLFSTTYKLDTATFYSVFVAGETVDKSFVTVDALDSAVNAMAVDTTNTSAMIRFVNASTTTGTLDFMHHDTTGNTTVTGCEFKYAGKFLRVAEGNNVIKVYQTGSSTPLLDTTLVLNPLTVYTFFTKGATGKTGNAAFGAAILTNDVQ